MRKKIRKGIVLVLSAIMAMSMCAVPAFAAGASPVPDTDSQAIQAASSDTATVTLGKSLQSSKGRSNKFPMVHDFYFEIERIEAWDNANESTAANGQAIAKANMPMPITSSAQHHQVAVSGDKATVTLGDFLNASEGTNTATQRIRTTPVQIRFQKAGCYVYRMKEIRSTDSSTAGIDYDPNEYFMVFYVCNRVDASGNTIDGVYVHSITSWTNEEGSETYKPNLTDIQNVTDHAGEAAGENGGGVSFNNDGSVTILHDDLGKVGVSKITGTAEDPATPNQLDAFRMWNTQSTRDLLIKENVTGNLGDRTKLFEFEVTLTNLEPGQTYTTQNQAEFTGDQTTAGKAITSISAGTLSNENKTFTATSEGSASFLVKLRDDETFVINDLPLTAQYQVEQKTSDHVASYRVYSSNQSSTKPPLIAKANEANTQSDKALLTAVETVNRSEANEDGTITVHFYDNRDLSVITGVPGLDQGVCAAVIALLLAAALWIIRRRKKYADEEAACMDA